MAIQGRKLECNRKNRWHTVAKATTVPDVPGASQKMRSKVRKTDSVAKIMQTEMVPSVQVRQAQEMTPSLKVIQTLDPTPQNLSQKAISGPTVD